MKKKIFYSLILVFAFLSGNSLQLDGQTNRSGKKHIPNYSCQNQNSFLKGQDLKALEYFTTSIYPNGTMILDPSRRGEYDSVEDLFQFMNVGSQTTFRLIRETGSKLDKNKQYRRYQQYYNGLEVEGGGYTTAFRHGGGTGDNPCKQAYLMSTNIASDIRIDGDVRNPSIKEGDIEKILNLENSRNEGKSPFLETKLVVSHNLMNDCNYSLAWKVTYVDKEAKISWIDAQRGTVLKTIEAHQHINAPTVNYGVKNMNDVVVGGTRRLQTPDGKITAYQISANLASFIYNYQDNLVPTTNSTWNNTLARKRVYQAFYATNEVANALGNVGVTFDKINVGAGDTYHNAFSVGGSSQEEAFIYLGATNSDSYATYDVVGHELGHSFLHTYINSSNSGSGSLHEGIGDMIGVYAESVIQGSPDWIMGDDSNLAIRNLENPTISHCYSDVVDMGVHDRSQPIGHWYYLISQGHSNLGIPSLGVENSLLIVLEALELIGSSSDYGDLRNATLAVVDDQFGYCSDESKALRRAWARICVGPSSLSNFNGCNYTINGPSSVCEETDQMSLSLSNGMPGALYRWRILGPKSTQWISAGNPQGNSNTVDGGTQYFITDFPKLPYYPQTITIEVYSPQLGSEYKERKRILIKDCNGDDPTCEEYFNL